jgi:hypothetical protein
MAMAIFGVVFYLIALAKWAKSLQEKNVPLGRRRIYGVIAAIPMLVVPLLYIGSASATVSAILFAWCAAWASLGYVTIVYRPKWIVGNR